MGLVPEPSRPRHVAAHPARPAHRRVLRWHWAMQVLFVGAKGDGAIRTFTISDARGFLPIEKLTGEATKALTAVPKRACDVMACEDARLLRVGA